MRKALKRHGSPKAITTAGLRSYKAAMHEIGNAEKQEIGRWANNRVENSNLPFRRRERAMLRFRQMKSLQKFSSVHVGFHNHFNKDRQRYETARPREQLEAVVQSWDTGMTAAPTSDYSVCTTWGYYRKRWSLLEVFRQQMELNELVAAARRCIRQWRPELVIIERAGSGFPLFQTLKMDIDSETGPRAEATRTMVSFKPRFDKLIRFESQTLKFEEGFCAFPENAIWLAALKNEMLGLD